VLARSPRQPAPGQCDGDAAQSHGLLGERARAQESTLRRERLEEEAAEVTREAGLAQDVVSGQLIGGLARLTPVDLDRIILAYEPVWAIGTGRTATPEQAQEMHAFIRRVFADRHSQAAANGLRILYGGSVKPDNIAGLMAQGDIDGALVGGASLQAESFAQIVNYRY